MADPASPLSDIGRLGREKIGHFNFFSANVRRADVSSNPVLFRELSHQWLTNIICKLSQEGMEPTLT